MFSVRTSSKMILSISSSVCSEKVRVVVMVVVVLVVTVVVMVVVVVLVVTVVVMVVVMVVVAVLVVHTVFDIDPSEPSNIRSFFAFEKTQAGVRQIRLSKDFASLNIVLISLTRDTCHLDKSQLNNIAPMNMPFMSVTLETSHLEISP